MVYFVYRRLEPRLPSDRPKVSMCWSIKWVRVGVGEQRRARRTASEYSTGPGESVPESVPDVVYVCTLTIPPIGLGNGGVAAAAAH